MRYDEFAILGSRSSFFPCHPMLRACDSCHKWPSTAKAVTSQVNLKNISEYVPTVPTAQTIGSDVGICQWLVAIVWMLLKIIDIHWWVSGYPMDPPCYTKVSMLQTTAAYSSYLSWQLHGMMWNVSPRMSTSSCAPHPGRCRGGSLCAPVIDASMARNARISIGETPNNYHTITHHQLSSNIVSTCLVTTHF